MRNIYLSIFFLLIIPYIASASDLNSAIPASNDRQEPILITSSLSHSQNSFIQQNTNNPDSEFNLLAAVTANSDSKKKANKKTVQENNNNSNQNSKQNSTKKSSKKTGKEEKKADSITKNNKKKNNQAASNKGKSNSDNKNQVAKKQSKQVTSNSKNKKRKSKVEKYATLNPGSLPLKAVLLVDVTNNQTILEQNITNRIPPASLTKVMTMYIILDLIKLNKASLNDIVTVSSNAAHTSGSRMGLKTGDKVTLEKLLKGMAVASGNDACVAAAEYLAGSEAAFVRLMNQKAKSLKLKNTTFKNTHGLPAEKQLTTAQDMYILASKYIKSHPNALQRYHCLPSLEHNGYTRINTNTLLDNFPGTDGLKTGYVNASGYNIILTAKRDGRRIMAVLLGAKSKQTRAKEGTKLLTNAFNTPPKKSK